MVYSYDPTQIKMRGKDQMRFELGDTTIDGGADTCALSDEEYAAILEGVSTLNGRAWKAAKLAALEGILFKLSYMVDTKIDVLSYGFGARMEQWQKLHEKLKAECAANIGVPSMDRRAAKKPPYFYTGMDDNKRISSAKGGWQ